MNDYIPMLQVKVFSGDEYEGRFFELLLNLAKNEWRIFRDHDPSRPIEQRYVHDQDYVTEWESLKQRITREINKANDASQIEVVFTFNRSIELMADGTPFSKSRWSIRFPHGPAELWIRTPLSNEDSRIETLCLTESRGEFVGRAAAIANQLAKELNLPVLHKIQLAPVVMYDDFVDVLGGK